VTAGAALVASSVAARWCSWNITPSLPRGLYVIHHAAAPAIDTFVVFDVPAVVSDLVSSRHYLPHGARLLKRIVAVAGDHVCLDGHTYAVNGRTIGSVRASDALGRPLPRYRVCGFVHPGEAYVATPAPLSFDSRYFGPVPLSALSVVTPQWTY
jgi:conjugative transfer signal peptidase TraF